LAMLLADAITVRIILFTLLTTLATDIVIALAM